MAKWPAFGRCKSRLSNDIGKINSLRIQKSMFNHTISVAKFLENQNYLDISLAITGIGLKSSRRWCKDLGINNFNFQGKGCLGERMKRQILMNQRVLFKNKKRDLIIIGTDLPDLCHMDLLETITNLRSKDLVFGPSNDGGYWLIAFSKKLLSNELNSVFTDVLWSEDSVLQNTLNNLSFKNLKITFLKSKVDIDTFSDLEQRR